MGLTILKRILGNFRGYSIKTWDCLDVDACTTLLGAPRGLRTTSVHPGPLSKDHTEQDGALEVEWASVLSSVRL